VEDYNFQCNGTLSGGYAVNTGASANINSAVVVTLLLVRLLLQVVRFFIINWEWINSIGLCGLTVELYHQA